MSTLSLVVISIVLFVATVLAAGIIGRGWFLWTEDEPSVKTRH